MKYVKWVSTLAKMYSRQLFLVTLISFLTAGVFSQQYRFLPVSQSCLACICEARSGCKTNNFCFGPACGPFGITWAYWFDGGVHTVNYESWTSPTAYKNCALDKYCSALTIQGYMHRYQQDCNGDGVIDCDDYAAIHMLGATGCSGNLPEYFKRKYQHCKNTIIWYQTFPKLKFSEVKLHKINLEVM